MNTKTAVRITRITTRHTPNLECGLFAALLSIKNVAKHLGVDNEKLRWKFISTARLEKNGIPKNPEELDRIFREKGWVFFNVGDGGWDQHGKKENRSLCQICSLDLVRGEYDFLKYRPWLREIYQAVRQNDVDGKRISGHPFNLRELMSALTFAHPEEPQLVLDFLCLAFQGIFAQCKAGVSIKKIFNPKKMTEGVEKAVPEQAKWFYNMISEAVKISEEQWKVAQKAVQTAKKARKVKKVWHTSLPINWPLEVIELRTASYKAGQAARQAGYDVVICWRPNGYCQIFSSTISEYGKADETGKAPVVGKWQIDMGEVAKRLRILEANFQKKRLEKGDWTASGIVYYESGEGCPWYVPEFRTAVFNGTQSSPDIPPTQIRHDKLLREAVNNLAKCRLLKQGEDGNWHHANIA